MGTYNCGCDCASVCVEWVLLYYWTHSRCQLSSAYRLCDWVDKISAGDYANGSTFKSSHWVYWIRNNIGFVSSTHTQQKRYSGNTDVNEIYCERYDMIPPEFSSIVLQIHEGIAVDIWLIFDLNHKYEFWREYLFAQFLYYISFVGITNY